MTHTSSPQVPSRRRRFICWGLLSLGLAALLLSLPFLGVKVETERAQADLLAARSALTEDEFERAAEHVASAREHVDDAEEITQGPLGDMWGPVPVVGDGVQDVELLVSALDDATSIAEIGMRVYPTVAGDEATIFQNKRIDLETLNSVLTEVGAVGEHLAEANESLEQVQGSAPLVGGPVARARDSALDQVAPLHDSFERLEPLLAELPDVLGAEREQNYLVAMLNPAELRYSGGAALALSTLHLLDGRVELIENDLDTNPAAIVPIVWKPVRGNDFHRPGPLLLKSATFAPSWSVSGEELLRAWQTASGEKADGLIAIDVVALSQLFAVTGPLAVPGYGSLTAENLVETLVGSYDEFSDEAQREALNSAIVPVFRERLFEGGQFLEKAQVLGAAADGRHFAVYFRDPEVQAGFEGLGLTGDLAESEDGPIGVFTQNTNGSKTDFWQRRTVTSDIALAMDGSAEIDLGVAIHNATPPYVQPLPDPRVSYFTRWSGMALSVFLPEGAEVTEASLQGKPFKPYVGDFYGRSWFYRNLTLPPGAIGRLDATYRVPDAVTMDSEGKLSYRLTLEPQGLVNPEAVTLTVHLPDGYTAVAPPEGWTEEADGTLQFTTEALTSSPTWEILAEPTS